MFSEKKNLPSENKQMTMVLPDHSQMIEAITRFFDNASREIFACLSEYTLMLTTGMEALQGPKRKARERGVRLRYLTEITLRNFPYVKAQLELVDELHNLRGIRGNFIISEREFMSCADISPSQPITQGFYSNVPEILKQIRYTFDTLWSHSVPAEPIIEELEYSQNISENLAQKRKLIESLFVCRICRSFFIYEEEASDHKIKTGHSDVHEFSLSDD